MPRVFRTSSFRLAALYAAMFALSTGVLFAIVFWLASDGLRTQARLSIENELRELTAVAADAGRDRLADEVARRAEGSLSHNLYYGLWDRAGKRIAGNLPGPPKEKGWYEVPAAYSQAALDRKDGPDQPETVLFARARGLADGRTVAVALDTFKMNELQEAIIRAFAWAGAVGIVLALFGGLAVSRAFLRRVDNFNDAMDGIVAGRLNERLTVTQSDDEFDRLGRNFNEMLDRLEASVESLKQVSNDIAHDLRTPLSRLRQDLEAARAEARNKEDYEVVVDRAVTDIDAILSTFAALLRIAQIEAGSRRAAFDDVDLSAMFGAIVESFGPVVEDQGRTLVAEIAPGIACRGDRELLTQMLVNLLVNAISHTPEGSTITVSLGDGPEGPVGAVADNGPGIPADARDRVFERFFRLDRSRSTAGNGLGLSLVAAVANLHGAVVALSDNNPGLVARIAFNPDTTC